MNNQCDWVEYELSRYKTQERLQIDNEIEEMRKAHQRRKEETELHARTAESWPEALLKQAALCRREDRMCPAEGDDYFKQVERACNEAYKIWQEEARVIELKIKFFEEMIREWRKTIRHRTGNKLAVKSDGTDGWKEVVGTLLDDDADPSDWLQW